MEELHARIAEIDKEYVWLITQMFFCFEQNLWKSNEVYWPLEDHIQHIIFVILILIHNILLVQYDSPLKHELFEKITYYSWSFISE